MARGPFPTISVHDTYEILTDKSAICTRHYVLHNESKKTITIGKGGYRDKFDLSTINHSINDNPAGHRTLDVLKDAYNKECYWTPSKIELSPDEETEIILSYDWPDFLPSSDKESLLQISNRNDRRIQYSLTIKSGDPTLIKAMMVKESTPPGVKIESSSEELRIGPVEISGGSPLFHVSIAIAPQVSVYTELPLLKYLSSQERSDLFSDCMVIMVQHMLGDFIPFVSALEQCGMSKENCYIIGIPYSTKEYVARFLRTDKKFPHVFTPTDYPFDEQVNNVLKIVTQRCRDERKKFLVIEDGGYVVPLLHSKEFSPNLKYCIGAVEQTKNGIWEDREIERKGKLKLPILSVADSKLKNDAEGKLIGQAVCSNIDRLLQKFARETAYEKKCLVIGLGAIGLNICRALKAKSAVVYGYDANASKMKDARKEGITIAKSISEKIGEVSLIIGSTGKSPINFSEIVKVRHNTVFVNATCKCDIEKKRNQLSRFG